MRILAGLAALALAACATNAETGCARACKLDAALKTANGAPIPGAARYTENGANKPTPQAWITGANNIAIHGEYADANGAIVVGTGTGADGQPALFGLRLGFKGASPSEAELLVVHKGEAGLFPPAIPMTRDPLFDAIVEPTKRTPPARMIAAANAYFDGIEKHNGKDVPVVDSCNRIENGVQTTRSSTYLASGCNSLDAFVYIPEVRERRFPVVNEERGVVVAAIAFYIPGGDYKRVINGQETMRHYDPRSLFLFEAFKVVDGKIEKIEATMRNVPLGTPMGWPIG